VGLFFLFCLYLLQRNALKLEEDDPLNKRLLVAIIVVQSLTLTAGWTQTSQSLQSRIPKPDPAKYHDVQDAKNWKNPYLIVRRDGVEIVGRTRGQAIPVESIPAVLEGLPTSGWPYGLVVAVQDIGVESKEDRPRVKANRTRLLTLLKGLGIAVYGWPSA
jgi:hypothetical protein